MPDNPLVSICVANYQGAAVLEACLNSLLSQVSDADVEIIVYDDASPDGSASIVRQQYPSVRLIEGRQNVGYCRANRVMAERARGEYMLLFNNDAWLLPGSFQALLDAARSSNCPTILGLPQFNAATGILEDRGRLLDPFFNAVPNLDAERQEVAMIAGACLWLPKKLWDELGGFPEWFESTGEDLYLCCAARLCGYPVRVLKDGGFHHWVGHSIGGGKVSEGRLSSTSGRRFRSERNRMAVVMACFPAPLNYLWVLAIAIQLLAEGICLAVLKFDANVFSDIYLRAVLDLIGRRHDVAAIELKPKLSFRRCNGFLGVMTWVPYKLCLLFRHGIPDIERRK
jgi:GT2 family glycosyltransferase